MAWFNSFSTSGILAEAQKRAEELSVKAREVAAQASVQARALAEQATAQAKVLAEKAAQETNQLQARLEKLAEGTGGAAAASASGGGGMGAGSTSNPAELSKYGVSDALIAHVMAGLTYSTFSDTNLDELAATNPLGLAPGCAGPGARLSAWQERHAVLALGQCEQLQHLRFALCPKRMTDTQFWMVYFSHCKQLLPPEAFGLPPLPGAYPDHQSSTSAGEAAPASSAKAADAAAGSSAANPAHAQPPGGAGGSGSSSKPAARGTTVAGAPTVTPVKPASGSSSGSVVEAGVSEGEGGGEGGAGSRGGEGMEDDGLDVDFVNGDDDDDLGELGDLEDDPELAAYLQEALDLDEAGGEGTRGGGDDLDDLDELGSGGDDLDDYIHQLDAELAASSVEATPTTTPAKK